MGVNGGSWKLCSNYCTQIKSANKKYWTFFHFQNCNQIFLYLRQSVGSSSPWRQSGIPSQNLSNPIHREVELQVNWAELHTEMEKQLLSLKYTTYTLESFNLQIDGSSRFRAAINKTRQKDSGRITPYLMNSKKILASRSRMLKYPHSAHTQPVLSSMGLLSWIQPNPSSADWL